MKSVFYFSIPGCGKGIRKSFWMPKKEIVLFAAGGNPDDKIQQQILRYGKLIENFPNHLCIDLSRNLKMMPLVTQSSKVIVGALSFNENVHDSKTLESVLEQNERLTERKPKEVYADRGYRRPKQVSRCLSNYPNSDKAITRQQRKKAQSQSSDRTGD